MTKENTENKKKRKLKIRFKILLLIIIVIVYSLTIGNMGIFTKDIIIKSSNIKNGLESAKIVQFSDLKYNSKTKDSDIKKIVKEINKSKADIVVFTGDLISKKHNIKKSEIEFLKTELSKINARCAKLYILGDEDFDESKNILNASYFTDASASEQVVYFNKASISFVGIDNINDYIANEHLSDFKVLLIHNPKDIEKINDYKFDLAVAGHTLNGEINIPKLKELFINSKYVNEKNKYKNTIMYVNPGLGKGKLNARLFNHPTIYLYRLKSA